MRPVRATPAHDPAEARRLLREAGLQDRQQSFDRAAWRKQHAPNLAPGGLLISLFCYEPTALPQLLSQLVGTPHHLLVTPGRPLAAVAPPAVAQQPLPAQSVPAPASDPVELSELQQVQKLMAAGQLKSALARADAHLAKNPRDAQMRFVRGVILSELKDTAGAREVFGIPGDFALLKVQATQTMEFCAREACQILGGASFMRGSRIERIYREVRVMAIGGGSEEIMFDLASRQYRF